MLPVDLSAQLPVTARPPHLLNAAVSHDDALSQHVVIWGGGGLNMGQLQQQHTCKHDSSTSGTMQAAQQPSLLLLLLLTVALLLPVLLFSNFAALLLLCCIHTQRQPPSSRAPAPAVPNYTHSLPS
jgi:hypothetical protein